MKALLSSYNRNKRNKLEDILDFHVRLEQIHPFHDGNGRVEYKALLDYFRIKH